MPRGRGFFKKAWNGLKKANSWLKDNKIISKYGKYIPVYGQTIGKVGEVLGYGRRGGRRLKMNGMGRLAINGGSTRDTRRTYRLLKAKASAYR